MKHITPFDGPVASEVSFPIAAVPLCFREGRSVLSSSGTCKSGPLNSPRPANVIRDWTRATLLLVTVCDLQTVFTSAVLSRQLLLRLATMPAVCTLCLYINL